MVEVLAKDYFKFTVFHFYEPILDCFFISAIPTLQSNLAVDETDLMQHRE